VRGATGWPGPDAADLQQQIEGLPLLQAAETEQPQGILTDDQLGVQKHRLADRGRPLHYREGHGQLKPDSADLQHQLLIAQAEQEAAQ